MKRIDKYTRAARSFYNLNRWICIRVDAIGGVFAGGLATFLIYGPNTPDAARTGFSLVMAVTFSGMVRVCFALLVKEILMIWIDPVVCSRLEHVRS
jgi:hypothetical protein